MRIRLRELLDALRVPADDGVDAHAEECLEALFDQERCACRNLGEHEAAQVDAERRRWTAGAGRPGG